jgi:hypothetical protein
MNTNQKCTINSTKITVAYKCSQKSTIQIWNHLDMYNNLYEKKTNGYSNKSCESKLNLKLNILCEHKAILWINMIEKPHTKVMEQHFLFYHLYIIYKLFIKL